MFGKALKATLGVGVGCVILIVGLVAMTGALVGGSRPQAGATTPPIVFLSPLPTSTAPAATAGHDWVAVKSWTGSGSKDTEKFTVGSEWRIDWIFTPTNQFAAMYISIYDDSARIVAITASTSKAGPDTSFQHKAGTFYLSINAANGDWKVAVQDFR